MKLALISDTHFGVKKNSKDFFKIQLEFFNKIFFPYLIKNKIDTVIHLGDFFDNRESLNVYIINQVLDKIIQKFIDNKINLYIIPGNHDIYYKNIININSLKILEISPLIKIIKDIELFDKLTLVPWDVDGLLKEKLIKNKYSDIAAGHFELKSFELIRGLYNKNGKYDENSFKNFNLIFSGHQHIRQEKNNIINIGTPYQLNWIDYADTKGFYILDTNTYKYKFIENTKSPKYIKLFYTAKDKKIKVEFEGLNGIKKERYKDSNKIKQIISNNFLKVYAQNQISKKFEQFILNNNKYNVQFILDNTIIQIENEENQKIENIYTILEKMLNKDNDKDEIINIFKILEKEIEGD